MIKSRPLTELDEADRSWAGEKSVRLGQLASAGFRVPAGLVVSAEAYTRFVHETGLRESIELLLLRKKFEDMRWEELWDLALRVRNLFLRAALPDGLRADLEAVLGAAALSEPLVIRSAGLGEDSKRASFAGLHDSFIDVRGTERILESIVLVWASLWSDRALLYRQELGLDPSQSRIAVIVQEFQVGLASGVVFSRSPTQADELLIEGVWGLNQGMVDGTVSPHRWQVVRGDGELQGQRSAQQRQALRSTETGARLVDLEEAERGVAPLSEAQVKELSRIAMRVEGLFASPQDVEWTLTEEGFVLLQARPITRGGEEEGEDKRRWYLTLHRSIDNLKQLRDIILQDVLPGMERDADEMARMDLAAMEEVARAEELRRRRRLRQDWIDAYWTHCIPFAHGMRIFGQVYNDHCKPTDPFEFVALLQTDALLGAQRDAEMFELAAALREVEAGHLENSIFEQRLERFLQRFDLVSLVGRPGDGKELRALLSRLSTRPGPPPDERGLRQRFLERFSGALRESMAELLDLARDSYRLRDDDNIYLGRIEAQLISILQEARRRVGRVKANSDLGTSATDLIHLIEDPELDALTQGAAPASVRTEDFDLRARQLVGQPARDWPWDAPASSCTRTSCSLFRRGKSSSVMPSTPT